MPANNIESFVRLTAYALGSLHRHPYTYHDSPTVFHSSEPVTIPLEKYLGRFVQHASLNESELRCVFIYKKIS